MKARKLAKLGRKREDGEREPNGRLSRTTKKQIEAKNPNEMKRLRDAAILGMRDPLWGTELGRLFLRNRIDEVQFEAGKRWRNLVDTWRKNQVGPQIDPKSGLSVLFVENRGRGRDRTYDPDVVAATQETDLALRHALDALNGAGQLESRTVRDCCEMEIPIIGLSEIWWLRDGLDALATHWRLGSNK
jgi:hypothetical protein